MFMHSGMTTYVTMASNLPKLSAMAAFGVIHMGGVYSQAVKKVVVVKSKEQQLREACSYTSDLFNAGCGSGCLVEGGYLHETLEGKVVWHGVALDPDVADIGARTQTVFHCSIALLYILCLLRAIRSWFLECALSDTNVYCLPYESSPYTILIMDTSGHANHSHQLSSYISPSTTNKLVTVSQGVSQGAKW